MARLKIVKRVSEDSFQVNEVVPAFINAMLTFHCIKNEQTNGTVQEGAKNWKRGCRAGISDFIVIDLKNGCIDYVELKKYNVMSDGSYVNKGVQSDAQKEFQLKVEFAGSKYYLISNPDELKDYIKKKRA